MERMCSFHDIKTVITHFFAGTALRRKLFSANSFPIIPEMFSIGINRSCDRYCDNHHEKSEMISVSLPFISLARPVKPVPTVSELGFWTILILCGVFFVVVFFVKMFRPDCHRNSSVETLAAPQDLQRLQQLQPSVWFSCFINSRWTKMKIQHTRKQIVVVSSSSISTTPQQFLALWDTISTSTIVVSGTFGQIPALLLHFWVRIMNSPPGRSTFDGLYFRAPAKLGDKIADSVFSAREYFILIFFMEKYSRSLENFWFEIFWSIFDLKKFSRLNSKNFFFK